MHFRHDSKILRGPQILGRRWPVSVAKRSLETRAVVSQDTVFQSLGLESLKSRSPSRLGTLKSRKMGMSRPYLLFLLWNYFSIQMCRKNPILRLPY